MLTALQGPARPSIEFVRPKAVSLIRLLPANRHLDASSQLEISVQRTIQREVDGEITEVNLKSYGEAVHIESSDDRSSDSENDSTKQYTSDHIIHIQ